MKKKLENNAGTKILSVVIAVILWLIVGSIDDPIASKQFTDIPVTKLNESVLEVENKVYQVEEGDTVSFTVKGKSSVINNMKASDFEATADFSKLSFVNAVPIHVEALKNSDEVEITMGKTDTMKVSIEDKQTALLPVFVDTTGTPSDGYAVGKKVSSPNIIEVTGPKSVIESLKEVRVNVDVDGTATDMDVSKGVRFYDQDGKQITSDTIVSDVENVRVRVELWKTKEIELKLTTTGKPASGYVLASVDYEPQKIEIAGTEDELEKIDSFELDPIDIDGLKESVEKTISLENANLPENAIFTDKNKDISIKIDIQKNVSKTIILHAEKIRKKGLSSSKKVSFEQSTYSITVEGAQSKLKDLTEEDFKPYIEVDDLSDGEHTVTLHVVQPEHITVTKNSKIDIRIY